MSSEFDVVTRENVNALHRGGTYVSTVQRRNLSVASACRIIDRDCVINVLSVKRSPVSSNAILNAVMRFGTSN